MVENTNTDGEPDYSQLNVYAGPEPPDLINMTVYEDCHFEVMGIPGRARIIGSSHCIILDNGYHEITSCRPVEMARDFDPVTANYDITRGIDDVLIRSLDGYRAEITIETRDHRPPYSSNNWDLIYTFGTEESGAPTAIRFTPTGWKTIHTYPEYEIELYTETAFFPVE